MFRTWPVPRATIPGSTSEQRTAGATRLTARTDRSGPRSPSESRAGAPPDPASLTRTSTGPSRVCTRPTAAASAPSSVTSAGTASAGPPRPEISAAVSSSGAARRPSTATGRSVARASAIARPTPVPPPVTKAVTAWDLSRPVLLLRTPPRGRSVISGTSRCARKDLLHDDGCQSPSRSRRGTPAGAGHLGQVPADQGGRGQHRRDDDRVVRLLPLRHGGRADLPEGLLPGVLGA